MSTLNHEESIRAYVEDYECLIAGIEYFLQLHQQVARDRNIEVIRRHYDLNPEDKLCHIYRPGSREMVHCRRSGIDAIHRTALRLVNEATNRPDLSSKRISEIISERILQVAFDGVTDDEEFVKILKSYVVLSEAEHVKVSYHFPCVLLHVGPNVPNFEPPPPDEIVLGPVKFRRFPVFLNGINREVELGEKHLDDNALKLFVEHGEKRGWVASVQIPSCAPDVSRQRAEEIVETAINLLKIFIGLRHGKSMRLPHTAPSRNRETCVLSEVDSNIKWTWQGRRLEGALVAGDPMVGVPEALRKFAAHLLTKSLSGDRSEMTNRLLDALRWFGDASFEESSGVQIVKWIAALERLTTTERRDKGITHNFCMRVALLASSLKRGDVERVYKDARIAYQLRSDVMHGSRSQNDEHLVMNAGFVHDLTRTAILGSLAVHNLLDARMGDARLAGIARFYDQSALRFEPLFKRLQGEFRKQFPQSTLSR
ncbi:MAG: hypothetical protein ABSD63_03965 [Candidatus Korobacteraceae bacterium]|jgi:hypothetical protein